MKRNPNLACPMISRSSFDAYESPVGERGRIISSRKEKERDLQEHGCVETQDLPNKGKLNNAKR